MTLVEKFRIFADLNLKDFRPYGVNLTFVRTAIFVYLKEHGISLFR